MLTWRTWQIWQDRGTVKAAILTNPAILTKFRQRAIELEIGVPMMRQF